MLRCIEAIFQHATCRYTTSYRLLRSIVSPLFSHSANESHLSQTSRSPAERLPGTNITNTVECPPVVFAGGSCEVPFGITCVPSFLIWQISPLTNPSPPTLSPVNGELKQRVVGWKGRTDASASGRWVRMMMVCWPSAELDRAGVGVTTRDTTHEVAVATGIRRGREWLAEN